MNTDFLKKKVSVIIPTYNRAKFLPNAVKSIIDQDYENIEIIIVDDGSIDNTQSVVESLKEKYPNILFFNNERAKGPSGARNTGIIKSSGYYLSFLDSDDVWLKGHLITGLQILKENPKIDVLFGNAKVVDYYSGEYQGNFFDTQKTLRTLNPLELSSDIKLLNCNLFEALIKASFVLLPTSIIRKDVTNGILMDELIMFSEDRDFAIRLYKQAGAIFAFREDPVLIIYKHDSNSYNTLNPVKKEKIMQNVIEAHIYLYMKYLKIFNLSKKEEKILNRLISKKLSTLSYIYSKNKEYKNAVSYLNESLKYDVTLTQVKYLMKGLLNAVRFF